jgi:hypothetical protein
MTTTPAGGMSENRKRSWLRAAVLMLLALAPLLVGVALVDRSPLRRADAPGPARAELARQVHDGCSACHAYPPPDSFPRRDWAREVAQGYAFAREFRPDLELPPFGDTVAYYESQAPEELALPPIPRAPAPFPVDFEPSGDGPDPPDPAVSNVNLVHLFDDRRLEVLACDMRHNVVKLLRPYEPRPRWQVLARAPHPVHTEVVDLDGDGVKDILVACLGAFLPTDERCGSVLWLRGDRSGGFTPVPLLQGVGRVADVRAADFNGDGKLDLVVASFGWRRVGSIVVLENRTTDWGRPVFVPHEIDPRHGAIHVPVADLNGDGRPDFVGLISQEHETVVAFLNEGGFRFRKEVIYTAPHPAYGSSGIELVDLDGDGDLDVLYTSGDSMDNNLIRPEHGVHWLENRGRFPFTYHRLATLFGAHRAVAADFDGDGDLDVLAVSFLPRKVFPRQQDLDSVILLEQVAPGRFVRHALQRGACDHVTCAAGDIFGRGRVDFVTGNFTLFTRAGDSVTLWRNRGKRAAVPRPGR